MNEQILQISARIRELREILDMDSKAVAEKLGIPEEEYLRYENGEDDIPISVLYDTARCFRGGSHRTADRRSAAYGFLYHCPAKDRA